VRKEGQKQAEAVRNNQNRAKKPTSKRREHPKNTVAREFKQTLF